MTLRKTKTKPSDVNVLKKVKAPAARKPRKFKNKRLLLRSTIAAAGACHGQLARFVEMFGEQVLVSKELCEKLWDKFDYMWAAGHLLSIKAEKDFDDIITSLYDKRSKIMVQAYRDYEDNKISYEKYSRTRDEQNSIVVKAQAIVFAECYIKDGA